MNEEMNEEMNKVMNEVMAEPMNPKNTFGSGNRGYSFRPVGQFSDGLFHLSAFRIRRRVHPNRRIFEREAIAVQLFVERLQWIQLLPVESLVDADSRPIDGSVLLPGNARRRHAPEVESRVLHSRQKDVERFDPHPRRRRHHFRFRIRFRFRIVFHSRLLMVEMNAPFC